MFLLDERVEANRLDKVGAQKRDFRVTHTLLLRPGDSWVQ